MIEQLIKDYDAIMQSAGTDGEGGETIPFHHRRGTIGCVIDLDFPEALPAPLGKKDLLSLVIPCRSGTSGSTPQLVWGTTEYVFGIPVPSGTGEAGEKAKERADTRHGDYLALLHECYEVTRQPDLGRLIHLIETGGFNTAGLDPKVPINFQTGTEFLTDDPALREWWIRRMSLNETLEGEPGSPAGKTRSQSTFVGVGQCMLCGEEKPILRLMPLRIPLNGSGAALLGSNMPSGDHGTLREGANGPLCEECAWKSHQPLRCMLESRRHHRKMDDIAVVYWASDTETSDLFSLLNETTDHEAMGRLLDSVRKGDASSSSTLPGVAHCLVLAGNMSRAAILLEKHFSAENLRRNACRWLQGQQVTIDGKPSGPYPLLGWGRAVGLIDALRPEGKKKQMPVQDVLAVYRAAYLGERLPSHLLDQAIALMIGLRLKKKAGWDERTKPLLSLLALYTVQERERKGCMTEVQSPEDAFGRYMGCCERLQREALGNVGRSLTTTHLTLALTAPEAFVSTVYKQVEYYLQKIGRDKPGLRIYFEKELGALSRQMQPLPSKLSLTQRAQVILSMYEGRQPQ